MKRNAAICTNCNRQISLSNFNRHSKSCEGIKFPKNRGIDYDPNIGYKNGTRKGINQYIKADKLGLERPKLSVEARQNMILGNQRRAKNESFETKKIRKDKISETVNDKIKSGDWHVSLAKNMRYSYNGVVLHGSWEYSYAKWLDDSKTRWFRCSESFPYIFEGKHRSYTPDFYLPDTNEYIEIKGYKTLKDEAKWDQFPKNKKLTILHSNDLKKLKII